MSNGGDTGGPVGRVPASRRSWWPVISVVTVSVVIVVMLAYASSGVLVRATQVEVSPVVGASGVLVEAQNRSQREGSSGGRFSVGGGETVQAPGWLEADPFYVAATALADGVIKDVFVLEGERVEKGAVIAELVKDDAELALARREAELASARAELAEARAEREAAQRDWDNPVQRERAIESARAALAETEAESDRLPALIRAERALLERMEEDLTRLRNAEASNAATRFEVILREKDVDRQAATLLATEQRKQVLEARARLLQAEMEAAERDYELRIEERRLLEVAEAVVASRGARVKELEAGVDEARLRLERMTIRAPISGFVQSRLKVPGDKVMLGMDDRDSAHILHLYDPEKIQVRVDVPLADASRVRVGQRCEVVVDVLPDRSFDGEVMRITHEADLQKNTLEVKVRVFDPDPILKPEMLTRVKFLPGEAGGERGASTSEASGGASARGTVLVDPSSLRERAGSSARVWVVRERRDGRGVARGVRVEVVGEGRDGFVRVRPVDGSLRLGDLVVVGDAPVKGGDRLAYVNDEMKGGGA